MKRIFYLLSIFLAAGPAAGYVRADAVPVDMMADHRLASGYRVRSVLRRRKLSTR